MLAPHKFPTSTELEHVSTLRQYQKLYELQHRAVLGLHEKIVNEYKSSKDVVYVAHAIPARISDFYGDFVQGDETRLIIQSPTDELREWYKDLVYENDLIEKIYDIAVEQSEFGYSVLHVYKDEDEQIKIETTPHDTYYPQSDGSVVIATYKKLEQLSDYLVLTQHYRVNGGNVDIERKCWVANNTGVIYGEKPLSDMETILGITLEPTSKIENLDMIPYVVINNGRKQSNGYGKSDYFDIMPNLGELNERATHISTQLLKNLSARMALPESQSLFDADGNAKDWDTLVVSGKESITPQYITNTNPLLADTMAFIMYQLKVISWVSSVPMWQLTGGTQPERVESMRIQLFDSIRKTNTKRAKIKRGLKDALRIASQLAGHTIEEDPNIEMSEIVPVDEYVETQVESLKVSSGLASRRSAIMRLENMTMEQADEEMKQIATEDKVAGVVGNPEDAPII